MAWNEPDNFRGVPWESRETALRQKLRVDQCVAPTDKNLGDRLCVERFTVGPVPVTGGYWFRADRLVTVSLSFASKDFATIEGAFIERYGAPTSTRDQALQNRVGAHFDNRIHEWRGDRIFVRLARYSSKITDGQASLTLRGEIEEFEKGREQERKKGAGDL